MGMSPAIVSARPSGDNHADRCRSTPRAFLRHNVDQFNQQSGMNVTNRLIGLFALVVVAVALAALVRRRGVRAREVTGTARLTAAQLGRPLGAEVTFVQFSTATCATCRPVRRTLGELAADATDVAHVELDAEHHPDLVREHRVLTTPTVLVLDRAGFVRRRLAGAIDRRALHEALAAVRPAATTPTTTPTTTPAPRPGTEVHHG